MNCEFPDVQAGFRKGRGTRDQTANICWIIKKAREFQKKHLFLIYWLCQNLWLCGSQSTVENSLRDGNTRPPDLPLEKPVCRSGSNSQNWTWKHVKYHVWNELPVQVRCTILDAWGWCTGITQRDGMGREEGGGFRMGNTCIPVADSFWYLAKLIQLCKV